MTAKRLASSSTTSTYNEPLFNYAKARDAKTKSFDEYAAKAASARA
jgi:hypothetical protein